MTREEADRQLREEPEEHCPEGVLNGFLENLEMTREEFDHLVDLGPRHLQFQPPPQKWWLLMRKAKRTVFSVAGIRKP